MDAGAASGARTVAHMAVYFEELKRKALALRDAFHSSDRGYFTPTEDEAARQLLVSYWQSRAALHDLIDEARGGRAPAEVPLVSFLLGFGAAVLLVDAARFLRETFGDSPVVRKKLNEPEPHFGIPSGVYDAVQSSLVSLEHAWHIHRAQACWEAREMELRALGAQDTVLAPVLAVIDRLVGRVRVSPEEYAKARLAIRARTVADEIQEIAVGEVLYGIQESVSRMVSDIHIDPFHHPALPPEIRTALRSLVRPGDVFITRKEGALTNYFLPGYWPHAAFHVGTAADLERMGLRSHENLRARWDRLVSLDTSEPHRVLEALKDGVWIRSLDSPFSSDSLAVIRPLLPPEKVSEAVARGFFHDGKPYDFDFDFTRSDRLVCTEVVYRSFEGIGGIRFPLMPRAGRLTLAAEDLLRMALARDGFETVAAYAAGRTNVLAQGGDVERVLFETMGPGGKYPE